MRKVGWVLIAGLALGCGGPEFSDEAYADLFRADDASVGEIDAGEDAVSDASTRTSVDSGLDAGTMTDVDADEPDSQRDAPSSCVDEYDAHSPIACQQVFVSAPSQYGVDAREDAGDVCVVRPMPIECQCASTYTCACLLSSPDAPSCPPGESQSCVLSYPELGGIVVIVCR